MRAELVGLLRDQARSLSTCPVCPVKGTCVFVTPGYEPGYCLHEYKLLHAFLAQRLRAHPPAGASDFQRLAFQAADYVAYLRRARPFDPRSPNVHLDLSTIPPAPVWPNQATLSRY